MKRFLAIALMISLALLSFSPASAQTAAQVVPGKTSTANCPGGQPSCFIPYALVVPLGYQQITSLSSAATLTVPAGATMVVIVAEGQAVRWRDDGTSPTASVGVPLSTNQPMVYTGTLSALSFIQTSATATLNVSYYK